MIVGPILRLTTSWTVLVALNLLKGPLLSEAFSPIFRTSECQRSLIRLSVGSWDNDDFLKGLSQGPADEGGFKAPKYEPPEEEEKYQGGSKFKQLMEAGQKAAAERSPRGPPIMYNPAMDPDLSTLKQSSPPPPQNDLENMSVEEQAAKFREMMQQQQQLQQQQQSAAPFQQQPPQVQPLPVRRMRPDPRPVGRNRDADTIANTADLYFAQLKRDSTVRTLARQHGDVEKANAVFEDEGIEKLNDVLSKNPHLKGDENNSFLDTSPAEMIAVMKLAAGSDEEDKSRVGISYKEKLRQRKAAKGGVSSSVASEKPAEPVPKVNAAAQEAAETFTPSPNLPETPPVVPVQKAASPVGTLADPDEIRRTIRTFMGLMLKHRGGPGFGKGRLKGAEAKQFEEKLTELTELLRAEALKAQAAGGDALPSPVSSATPSAPVTQLAAPPSPPAAVEATFPSTATAPENADVSPVPDEQRVASMIACVEGAVMMYKHSPPELKESAIVTLRSALMSAVNTCSQMLPETVAAPPVPGVAGASPAEQRITSMIACVEGAVQMYKHSPSEIKESALVTLRAALMSAVNTCNQLIAESEAQNVQNYQAFATPATNKPPSSNQFFEVKPYETNQEGESAGAQAAAAPSEPPRQLNSGTDENSKFFQGVLDSLTSLSGDEKFGLSSISPDQAASLADKLHEMKGLLVDELNSGIPQTNAQSESAASVKESPTDVVSSTGSATSKYQQMLARAKAEKQ